MEYSIIIPKFKLLHYTSIINLIITKILPLNIHIECYLLYITPDDANFIIDLSCFELIILEPFFKKTKKAD